MSGRPRRRVQFIDDADRALVTELLTLDEYVDMIIPRGGAGLHKFCREHSRIPVITGGIGICHLFVDESADLAPALSIIFKRQGAAAHGVQRARYRAGASRSRRRVPAARSRSGWRRRGRPARRRPRACHPASAADPRGRARRRRTTSTPSGCR